MSSETVQVKAQNLVTIRQLLESEDTYATVLLVILIDYYGTDFIQWHPETIKSEIEADFGVQLPRLAFDKIMAGCVVLTNDSFFRNAQSFIHVCNVFSGSPFNPEVFDPADPYECAWGMSEALLLVPPEEENAEPFSDEVRSYIGQVLNEWGYVTAPDILSIALDNNWTDQVTYDFADDPEMFSAIYKNQDEKSEEINATIKENLLELFSQLRSVPMQNGSTESIGNKIFEQLKGET